MRGSVPPFPLEWVFHGPQQHLGNNKPGPCRSREASAKSPPWLPRNGLSEALPTTPATFKKSRGVLLSMETWLSLLAYWGLYLSINNLAILLNFVLNQESSIRKWRSFHDCVGFYRSSSRVMSVFPGDVAMLVVSIYPSEDFRRFRNPMEPPKNQRLWHHTNATRLFHPNQNGHLSNFQVKIPTTYLKPPPFGRWFSSSFRVTLSFDSLHCQAKFIIYKALILQQLVNWIPYFIVIGFHFSLWAGFRASVRTWISWVGIFNTS